MSRNTSVGLVLLTMVTVACSEQVTSPKSRHAPVGAPSLDVIVNSMASDSATADFTITPSGGTFVMGPHAIHFPANAVCNPETSGYGVDLWDAPCAPATTDIQVHAEVRTVDGYSYVHFTPELRFVPTDNPSDYVWILMKSEAAKTADLRAMNIFWAPELGEDAVNEAVSDTTLRTYVWRQGGVVFRRVKHFSYYTMTDGVVQADSSMIANISDVIAVDF